MSLPIELINKILYENIGLEHKTSKIMKELYKKMYNEIKEPFKYENYPMKYTNNKYSFEIQSYITENDLLEALKKTTDIFQYNKELPLLRELILTI